MASFSYPSRLERLLLGIWLMESQTDKMANGPNHLCAVLCATSFYGHLKRMRQLCAVLCATHFLQAFEKLVEQLGTNMHFRYAIVSARGHIYDMYWVGVLDMYLRQEL